MNKKSAKGFKTLSENIDNTLIKQSVNYTNWQVVLKFNYFEMHVVREIGSLGSDNSTLMNLCYGV